MATDVQSFIQTGEEDDEEEMEMDVKEEGDLDKQNGHRHIAAQMMMRADGMGTTSGTIGQFQSQHLIQEAVGTPGGGSRRSRPLEEKERTKLRERNRRAITAKILAGLRRHGNYNLRVRADINDVIAALAREAGWTVLPDGTTFPSRSQVLIFRNDFSLLLVELAVLSGVLSEDYGF